MSEIVFPTFSGAEFIVTDIEPEDIGIVTDFENGSQTSRPRFTKSRLTFSVEAKMFVPELTTFLDFYRNTIKGVSQKFLWTNKDKNSPYFNQTFTVRMTALTKPQKIKLSYWQVVFTLREA